MEGRYEIIELRKFWIQDPSTPILKTRESEQEPRERVRFLIQILCIIPAVLQGYSGGEKSSGRSSMWQLLQKSRREIQVEQGPEPRGRGLVVVVEEGLGLGESMKSPFSVLHGAQSIHCSFTAERQGIDFIHWQVQRAWSQVVHSHSDYELLDLPTFLQYCAFSRKTRPETMPAVTRGRPRTVPSRDQWMILGFGQLWRFSFQLS